MGNKPGRRRQAVEEKYTRPQGLYEHREIDHKKLRKLILDSKLAPCHPGVEECGLDLEECPICFLYYPSLNRSRCCMKGVCTECFLQMKPPHSARPMQCPFCKAPNYAVEYRGLRTKEEKGVEQIEEQRVIEAQIRMHQQELQDEEKRTQKRQDVSSSSRVTTAGEVDYRDISKVPSFRHTALGNRLASSHGSFTVPASRWSSYLRQNREDNFDLDLEEIMVMEAIWLSIQERGGQRSLVCGGSEDCHNSFRLLPTETSPGGLACTVAALAEHQHMNGDSAGAPVFDTLRRVGSLPAREERSVENHPSEMVPREEGEWSTEHGPEVAEARTSYASSDVAADAGAPLPLPEGVNMAAGHLLPHSFEEQMMLAMAISLAEAQARTSLGE